METNLDQTNGNLDIAQFHTWLINKEYSVTYIKNVMSYTSRFNSILFNDNIKKLDSLPHTISPYVVKSLILVSKYLGIYPQFKAKLNQYDIKISKPDSMTAFLRIMKASDSDIIQYYQKMQSLKPSQALFAKFLLNSGLRTSEAIHSFNLIIDLAKQNELNDYYNTDLNCLMHFKYGKLFLRGKKNAYITFISQEFLRQVANSNKVSYASLRKQIVKHKLTLRFNEFRDKFGTHLVNKEILEADQNLCCGRISSGIFVKHYWSPQLAKLGNRILKALTTIES